MIDLPRLHRFLVEHGTVEWQGMPGCIDCTADTTRRTNPEPHAPDCEWVALVAMTKEET